MRKQIKAEAHIMDRIMYLLEEGSISHLGSVDGNCKAFVDGQRAETLRRVGV